MKYPTLLALAVLAWPALNLAQTAPKKTTPAIAAVDPAAPAPALLYRSALAYSPRGVVQDSDDWSAANARVGQFVRGHSDILKAEQAPAANQPASSPSAPASGARR